MLKDFTIVVLVVLLSIIFSFNFSGLQRKYISSGENYDLVIAVLSARQNVEQRNAIRRTWAKDLPGNSLLYFVLGSDDCPYSPEERVNNYGCEEHHFNFSEISREPYLSASKVQSDSKSESNIALYGGFAFTALYDIRIRTIGVLSSLLSNHASVKIGLFQGSNNELIVSAVIDMNIPSSHAEVDGFTYAPVDEFVFPKGFEGLIRVFEGYVPKITKQSQWDPVGGVLSYNFFYRSASQIVRHSFENAASATSFQFVIHNTSKIIEDENNRLSYKLNWSTFRSKLYKDLESEEMQWQDIIFVDCIDVYQALPRKLLLFYKWLTENSGVNYKFLLKTDDDNVIIIDKVLQKLHSVDSRNAWWGKFRVNWAVNHYGKWADYDYTSYVYPAFACGSGYVLSHDLVEWLAHNNNNLHPYQGEDVSLGIWLAALNPELINDDIWNCEDDCLEGFYNRAQLTVNQILATWKLYQTCSRFCSC